MGPIYAALLEKGLGWRSVYWVLAGLSALLLVLTAVGLEESRNDTPRKLDPLGVITLGAGTSCLIAGLYEGRHGWVRPLTLVLLVHGVVLLALFVLVQAKVSEPMLDPALFRSPGFIASSGGALFTGLPIVGLMSYLPTVIQVTLGQSPLGASWCWRSGRGLSVVSALQARRLATKLPATTQVAASLLLCGIGEAILYGAKVGGSWTHVAAGLAIAGVGSGVLNAALARLAISSVPPHQAAMDSGTNNSARHLGSALGVALMVTVVSQSKSAKGPAYAMAEGINHAFLVAALLCGAGAAIALWARTPEARAAAILAVAEVKPTVAQQTPAAAP